MFQLTPAEMVLFALTVVASTYLSYQGFRKVYLVIRRGQGAIPTDELPSRLLAAARQWLLLLPTWRARPGSSSFHALIAWAFMFYVLVNVGDVISAYFGLRFLGEGLIGDLYRLLADLLSVAALVGMVYFLLRRFVFHSRVLTFHENVKLMEKVRGNSVNKDSLIVGLFIILHVGFRFLGETLAIAREGRPDAWQPFASAVSGLWGGLDDGTLVVLRHGTWWIALGLILAFIPYFPYTKHVHLIMAGFNFLLRPQRAALGALEPLDFEDETIEQFGVATLEHLSWKHLLDAYACIMCNRCQDVCPAYTTGKELSPSALEINKRYFINAHLDALASGETSPPLLDYAISESALWACTACGACIHVCPVGNEPMFDILYLRRNQVLMESRFPRQLQQAFRGMERSGNPWNLARSDRMAWAKGVDIPTVEDNPAFELLWWIGCAPSYDMRAQKTARAFAQILQTAGVNFAVLGELENCSGDAARRAGHEALFYELALANIEVLNEFQADQKRIVTTCPHCLHALGKEYSQYGGHYTVIHSSQLIAELVEAGRLQLATRADSRVTFHDPCYLGRHNGVLNEPRLALQALNGRPGSVVEMPRHGRRSFCCGAGGAQMWKEEEHGDAAVNMTRYQEAAATGAQVLAVACPFCLTMLSDAAKQADNSLEVKDLVELVAEGLA